MAVYPVVPGNPDYSTGSSSQYIPAIYSALLIKKFYPETVFGKISNTDYEGDIKSQGDTVYIRTRPTIETFSYKKGMVLPVQNPESPYVTLKIDQGEGFSFAIDKVDEFQSDIKLMSTWAEDAAQQMKQVIDRKVLCTIAKAAGSTQATYTGPSLDQATAAKGFLINGATTAKGTTVALGQPAVANSTSTATSANLVAQFLKWGRYLDENNAPQEGRFAVLPFWAIQVLKDISAPFGQAYATGQNSANIMTNSVPRLAGFDVIGSNNLGTGNEGTSDQAAAIFGCKYATTFATQITESRTLPNPFAFGTMMQGLQVYGFNIIKPQLIGVDFIKNA